MPIKKISSTGDAGKRFGDFPAFVDHKLSNLVTDTIDFGQRRMAELVPVGDTGRLQEAVTADPNANIAKSSWAGGVFIDTALAPYAGKVDQGTGVDGPYQQGVEIFRASFKNPNRRGKMRVRDGIAGPFRFTTRVKFNHSSKIERGKNFSGRTYRDMDEFARLRVAALNIQIAMYFKTPQ